MFKKGVQQVTVDLVPATGGALNQCEAGIKEDQDAQNKHQTRTK